MTEKKTKKTKQVSYFTDEMHKEIFPFQPAISIRGYSGNKPIIRTISISSNKK